jgi:hypothetical protein
MTTEWKVAVLVIAVFLLIITALLIEVVNDLSSIRWQLENR